ncbi:MAG: alpha/beta hydrolase [Oscillospiraceae bacterium]|jgi:acetyl esterase/lipase|nr:alpha/beta hydrolase [Oscillospiraceae bacterium]
MKKKAKTTIRDTNFVPERIDMTPKVPMPRTEWIKNKKLDLPYGTDPLQTLDLYYPKETKEKYPLVILVHGGGFTHCDKRDFHLYPGFFTLDRGFALASVNYRLAPKDPYPAAVEDVKDAVAYLRGNAAELNLDSGNFFLYGTSAGGNLVACAGLDGGATAGGKRDYHVNAVADLCGLINFNTFIKQPANPLYKLVLYYLIARNGYIKARGRERARQLLEASADSRISSAVNPPAFYIQHGDLDPAVNVRQSISFYEKLKDAGIADGKLKLHIMKGVYHAGAGPEYLERENVDCICDFFIEHMI